jgi:hypothetical protein
VASEPDSSPDSKHLPIQASKLPPPTAASQFLLASIWRAGQARGEAQDGEYHESITKEDIRAQEGHRKGDGEKFGAARG